MVDINVIQIVKEKTKLIKPVKRIENREFNTNVYYLLKFYKKIARYSSNK